MRDKKIFIADGHHRYEVALAYRDKMGGSKYVMMYFTNLGEKAGITILSTHRVVKNIKQFDRKKIEKKLEKCFYIAKPESPEQCMELLEKNRKKEHVFGMYIRGKAYLLTLKEKLKKLDVAVLHDVIINDILAVKNPENNVKYIRNEEDAVKVVDNGDYQVAFFLRPTDVMDMKRLAEKGEMMPQKSTYFYPKLLTGLVINRF